MGSDNRIKRLAAAIAGIGSACVMGAAVAAPVQWTTGSGGNDHWYEYLPFTAGVTWQGSFADAASRTFMGMQGYMVTVTSAAENVFAAGLAPGNFWAGATDSAAYGATPGIFRWVGGPENGLEFFNRSTGAIGGAFTAWAGGEPNNCCGGEPFLVGKWSGVNWNDLYSSSLPGYVIEYSATQTSVVPVPGALVLSLSGLAALGFTARRRRSGA